jgi:hypothetical protein
MTLQLMSASFDSDPLETTPAQLSAQDAITQTRLLTEHPRSARSGPTHLEILLHGVNPQLRLKALCRKLRLMKRQKAAQVKQKITL